MLYFKKGIGIALFALLLLLILTGSASASDIQISDVYYEAVVDGEVKVVKVDFARAVSMAQDDWPRDRTLYDAAVKGIGDALLNERDVVIVVKKDGTDYILDYAEMIEAGEPSISDAIAGTDYRTEVPEHDLELLVDQTGKAEPKPADRPAWLLEDIETSWIPLAQRYLVIIEVDFDEILEANNWQQVYGGEDNRLKLRGVYVNKETGRSRSANLGSHNITLPDDKSGGVLRLLVRDPGVAILDKPDVPDDLVIRKQDIEIITKVGTTTYTYTWEGVTEKED